MPPEQVNTPEPVPPLVVPEPAPPIPLWERKVVQISIVVILILICVGAYLLTYVYDASRHQVLEVSQEESDTSAQAPYKTYENTKSSPVIKTTPVEQAVPDVPNNQVSVSMKPIPSLFQQNSVFHVQWSSTNVPPASYVALSVIDAETGESVGVIDGRESAQGTYDWSGNLSDIDVSYSIIDVQGVQKCTGNLCEPKYSGKYRIRAELRPEDYCVMGQSGVSQSPCTDKLLGVTESNVFTVIKSS